VSHDELAPAGHFEVAIVTTLKRVWLAILIEGAAVACARLLTDAWQSVERDRLDPNLVEIVPRYPSDYSSQYSTNAIDKQLRARQKAVERELESLWLQRSPEPSSGALSRPLSSSLSTQSPEHSAAMDARIHQLEAEDKQVREQVDAQVLADCRQRMMRRGIVVGNGPCTDLDDFVKSLLPEHTPLIDQRL
jgi:hypothetical protein